MAKPFASYDPVSKALHWIVAFAILLVFVTAMMFGADVDFIGDDLRHSLFTIHKTAGFCVLFLMIVRVFWGSWRKAPPLPLDRFPKWQAFAARFVHDALYALAILTPFIGWVLVSLGTHKLMLFGFIDVPPIPYMDEFKDFEHMKFFVAQLHETLAIFLACLLVVHIGATFLHHFVDRDEILLRISPTCLHPWLEKIRGNRPG